MITDESTGSVDGWDTLQAFPVSLQDVPGLANHSLSPHSQDSVSRGKIMNHIIKHIHVCRMTLCVECRMGCRVLFVA